MQQQQAQCFQITEHHKDAWQATPLAQRLSCVLEVPRKAVSVMPFDRNRYWQFCSLNFPKT